MNEIEIIKAFLARVDLKGHETPAFMQALAWLEEQQEKAKEADKNASSS